MDDDLSLADCAGVDLQRLTDAELVHLYNSMRPNAGLKGFPDRATAEAMVSGLILDLCAAAIAEEIRGAADALGPEGVPGTRH